MATLYAYVLGPLLWVLIFVIAPFALLLALAGCATPAPTAYACLPAQSHRGHAFLYCHPIPPQEMTP